MARRFSQQEIQDLIADPILVALDEAGVPSDPIHVLRVIRAVVHVVARIALDHGVGASTIKHACARAVLAEAHRHEREKFLVGRLFGPLPPASA